jgi:hypothetical protein
MRIINASPLATNLPLVLDCVKRNNLASRDIDLFMQMEHTLVARGGRSVPPGTPVGAIPQGDGDNYYVRVDKMSEMTTAKVVLDYSMTNLVNVLTCRSVREFFAGRLVYAPAMPFDYRAPVGRYRELVTTFTSVSDTRRKQVYESLLVSGINYENVTGVFGLNELRSLYSQTKILVNVHQTDHHHTFEEFRALPALLCGCIVVSERVPLSDVIPYGKFVIWADKERLVDVAVDVSRNYSYWFHKIHGDGALKRIFETMRHNFNNDFLHVCGSS